ncbi:LytTR family transcriptional regulator [Fulvivirga sp. RKSG066]|uniref:LytR/AlgR family response regulator transcription factor n=1 Tax=Fulvivirga aurantia TaxID=2529383 RepID=UPI0012BCEF71|nr:LytTR family DNA-binding domain-containing protein [Fulvivirga aurantia]MTI20091.1 LytTR family transcriptional regulator [Fulvivirga aurantia]
MLTTVKIWSEIKLLRSEMNKVEMYIHLLIWIGGLILINQPALNLTVGIFYSYNLSLLLPSLTGVVCNALIFYGMVVFVRRWLYSHPLVFLTQSILWFLLFSFLEILSDLIFYYFFYGDLQVEIVIDEIAGSFILNGIFFHIPGTVYGIIKTALKKDPTEQSKILIKDGSKSLFVDSDRLLFVESDGNYCAFQTKKERLLQRISLTQLESSLPPQFVRCHKSFIINKHLVESQTAKEITIQSHKIPIGRRYADRVKS